MFGFSGKIMVRVHPPWVRVLKFFRILGKFWVVKVRVCPIGIGFLVCGLGF